MAVPVSEDGGGYHSRNSAPVPPRSSRLTSIFGAVAGVAVLAAALVGLGYVVPEVIRRLPEEVEVGAVLGATIGLVGGYCRVMTKWGTTGTQDLLTLAFGAAVGGVAGGFLGAGWHLNDAATHVASSVTSGAREMVASIASVPQRFL